MQHSMLCLHSGTAQPDASFLSCYLLFSFTYVFSASSASLFAKYIVALCMPSDMCICVPLLHLATYVVHIQYGLLHAPCSRYTPFCYASSLSKRFVKTDDQVGPTVFDVTVQVGVGVCVSALHRRVLWVPLAISR